jgi:hypothetical protein
MRAHPRNRRACPLHRRRREQTLRTELFCQANVACWTSESEPKGMRGAVQTRWHGFEISENSQHTWHAARVGEGLNFRKFFRKFASPEIFGFRKFPWKFASLVSFSQLEDALKTPRRAVKADLRLRRRFFWTWDL